MAREIKNFSMNQETEVFTAPSFEEWKLDGKTNGVYYCKLNMQEDKRDRLRSIKNLQIELRREKEALKNKMQEYKARIKSYQNRTLEQYNQTCIEQKAALLKTCREAKARKYGVLQ